MNFGKNLLFSALLILFTVGNALASDFYWVGNSGDWNDASHWANTSGGAGGIGVPTSNDDVYFDANSFNLLSQNVSLTKNISLRDLRVSSNSTNFRLSSNTPIKIDIYGVLNISTTLNNNLKGTLQFLSKSSSSKSINFGPNSWNTDIIFNGKGTYILDSPIHNVNNSTQLTSGTLDLNQQTVYCGSFISNSEKKRSILSDNSSMYIYNQWETNPNKLISDFSNTKIYVLNSNLGSVKKNGGQINIAQETGTQLKTITSTSIVTDTASCGDQCDGMIIVNFTTACVTGATVSWNASSNPDPNGDDNGAVAITTGSDTIFNVCPGIEYTATIIDDCDASPAFPLPKATVLGHSRIDLPIAPSITEPSCNGVCDGSISVFVDAAGWVVSNNYLTYQWSPGGVADTTTSLANMCSGTTYSLQVDDANGCDTTFTFDIPEPDSLFANVTVTNPFCFNECSGSAISNPVGGTAPYSYSWSPPTLDPALDTIANFDNLCSGTAYTVSITDANGCTNDTTFTPVEPLAMTIDTSSTRPSCGGDSDGSITVTVTGGGTGPFTHSWSTGFSETIAVSISSTISNLSAGNYCDTITDFNGCDTVICFNLTEPDTVLTSTTTTDITCNGICDGTATTIATGGTQPYTYAWDSIPNAGGFTTFDSIVNLCPGTYFVTVSDFFNCSVSDTVVITEPLPLTLTLDSTNITCNGADNGTATATATGGTPGTTGYSYSWTGPSCTPCLTQSISSLEAGTYTVVATDSLGCQATASITIIDPPVLVLTMSSTDETCDLNCDGTASVDVTGGSGNPATFTYVWTPDPGAANGQGTDSIFNLCPGNYSLTVTDDNNCMGNSAVTVDPSPAITPNLTSTDVTCNGDCNGTATVSPTGTLSFTVSWDGILPATNIPDGGSITVSNLCAGTHTALITDGNGCTELVSFDINEPNAITTTTNTEDVSCFGLCDGTATTNASGGSGNLAYNWTVISGGPIGGGAATDSIFNTCEGTYYVTITDDSLCSINDTIEIFTQNPILPNATFTDITCNGLDDGTATANPTGGNGVIASIVWSTSPLGVVLGAGPLSNLSAGDYEVVVTDGNGCTGTEIITITDPLPLTVTADATSASCGNICDGSALATTTGGSGDPATDFSYSWTGPSTSNVNPATNLCIGTYTVIVTDTNGCTAQDTTEILPSIEILINPTIVGISCNGVCDGEATVFPIGGTLPYSYSWAAPSTSTDSIATGLCPGFAIVTVTDDLGCSVTDSVNMPVAPTVLQANAVVDQQISCSGLCDAQVSHSPTGGSTPYTSVWSITDTNNVCSAPLAFVTVTDDNGCIDVDTLTIADPNPIIANDVVVDVQCFGDSTGSITLNPSGGAGGTYTYAWNGPMAGSGMSTTGLIAGEYTITITDSNGCFIEVTDTINEPPLLSATPITNDISCSGDCDGMMTVSVSGGVGPYSYTWAINSPPTLSTDGDSLLNICATPAINLSNTVTVQDDNGCQVDQLVTITNPTVLDANVTGTGILCNNDCNGTAISNPTGGTAPYTYLWTPSAPAADSAGITGLCFGNYFVTVTDDNNCTDTATYTVSNPLALIVTLDSTNITCNGNNDGTATANITGGTAPFTISWVGGNAPTTDTNFIDNLIPGVYTVTVTDDNGCSFQASITIEEPQAITNTPVVVDANCGATDGSITMDVSGGTQPYSYSWDTGNPADTNAILTNLGAGFYTDTVTDANGCIEIFTIGVSNPNGPSGVTSTINDATCYGTCTGSINVIVIGGTPNFTYSWTGPNGFTGTDTTETGLCAGTYSLTVTDASSCVLATNLVVGEADSITANSIFTDATCNGICDGTASVTPTGGTAPYSFVWSNSSSTGSSVSGLCAGPVSVTISDFYGCQKTVDFVIGSPNSLTVTSNTTNPTCNGDCDGTATANPTNGTAPYTYQWNDANAQSGQTATGLCDGTYIVTVTDFNGCSENDTVTIVEPTIISVTPATTNSTCGNSDGTADVCGSIGGTGNHSYLWTDIPGNPTTCALSGLAAGTYTVEISDDNLCMQSFLITISDANGPTVNVNATNATCDGLCDGQATATATGTANFSYLWQTGNQFTPTITGLCAGNYSVEVTDGNGCITTEPVTIIDNTAITATVSTVETTCNGDCDGSALVTPSGGTAPYSYSWTGGNAAGQTINAVGGLCAGNYTVTITDFLGCSITVDVVITEPAILTTSVSGIAANCNNSCDGQATATPSGGTGPYTYLWSNNATTPTITALCAGNYTVTITDFKGCTAIGNVIIGDGVAITATITPTDANCGQCDGAITVAAAGGSGGPYNYSWSGLGLNTPTITDLCPGAYILDVTDNLGCTEQFNILINNANGPTLTTLADSASCFGTCNGLAYTTVTAGTPNYSFQWDDPALQTNDSATGLCAGLYNIVVQDGVGCITVDTVSVIEPEEIIPNFTFTDPTCPGACDGTITVAPTGGVGTIQALWGASANNQNTLTATNLCAGTHSVTLTDANGCTTTDSITISDPTAISITASATPPTCFGDCDGTAIANASGGNPGYQYSWNTTPVNNNSLVGGLCAGVYTVTVTDNNGCSNTADVQVIDPTVLGTTTTIDNSESCNAACDGSITTTPTGGQTPYTYLWSNNETTATITNLCEGTYDVLITDANNCTFRDTVTLDAPAVLDAVIVPGEPDCGVCNGSINSTPITAGQYNFVWANAANPTVSILTELNVSTSNVSGLCAGTYNLELTDLGTGCTSNYVVILNSLTGPTLALTSTDETCLTACDGTATATPTGGTAPYSYSWSPTTPTDTNQTATNLCPAFYTVTVTDSNNCVASDTLTINTIGLSLSITNIIPETCFGNCDGSATAVPTGGNPNYNFSWSPTGGSAATSDPLCVGTYVVTVTDDVNCSDSISTNITGPDELTVVATENTPVSCNGLNDGAAIANVLGGTVNYQYSWNTSPIQTTQIATNLGAGTYIVVITDDNNCTATDTITLTESTPIVDNPSFTDPACGVCDGSIQVSPSGGSGNYDYSWTTPGSPPATPQFNTQLISNLCAGAYTLTITDNTSGCSADFAYALSNTNGPDPNLDITNVTCNGLCDGAMTSNPIQTIPADPYTYAWNPSGNTNAITNLCEGQYEVTVTDTNGCVGVAIDSITQPDILQANLTATNINCNGICDGTVTASTTGGTYPYSYSWTTVALTDSNLTALCAGTYIITILDSNNNCTVTDSISVTEPTQITSTSTQTDATCISSCDGEGTVTPSGGIGPYTFQWNGNTAPNQGSNLTGLCFGINEVEIFDQNGCSIIDTIYIGAIDTILADAGIDTNYCIGTPVNLTGVPGGSFTSVEWFELPAMTSLGTANSVTTTPAASGVICYAFQVNGACTTTDTVCITVDALPSVDAGEDVNIFEGGSTQLNATGAVSYSWSPTTGLSDSTISNPVANPTITTTYYVTGTSTNGCIATDSVIVTVLPSIKFPDGISPNGDGSNDTWIIDFIEQYPENVVEIYNRWGELLFHAEGYEQNWDGTYNGKELPIGTYYYIIDLNDEEIKPFTGPITILR